MRERYPDGRVKMMAASLSYPLAIVTDVKRTKRRRRKTEIAPGEFQSQCMLSGRKMMDREKEREEESLNAYTYHHLACLPINF